MTDIDLKSTIAAITNEHVGKEVLPVHDKVKRYDFSEYSGITEQVDGDYVRHEDYEKLEQRLAVMREALEAFPGRGCSDEQWDGWEYMREQAIKQSEAVS